MEFKSFLYDKGRCISQGSIESQNLWNKSTEISPKRQIIHILLCCVWNGSSSKVDPFLGHKQTFKIQKIGVIFVSFLAHTIKVTTDIKLISTHSCGLNNLPATSLDVNIKENIKKILERNENENPNNKTSEHIKSGLMRKTYGSTCQH